MTIGDDYVGIRWKVLENEPARAVLGALVIAILVTMFVLAGRLMARFVLVRARVSVVYTVHVFRFTTVYFHLKI